MAGRPGGGVVLAGLDALAPWLPAAGAAYPLTAIGSVVGLLAGVRLNHPPTVRPWLVMAAGLACLVVGDLLDARRGLLLHGDREPVVGDLPHLIAYPLLAAGFLLLAHDRRPGDRAGRIEAWIVGASGALVFVELLIRPALDAGPGSPAGTLVSTAYPVGDVLLVLGVARLATAAAGRTRAGRLLLGAGLLLLVADTISILFGVYASHTRPSRTPCVWCRTPPSRPPLSIPGWPLCPGRPQEQDKAGSTGFAWASSGSPP